MAFEIITYGAGPYLDNVFNGIAALVKSEDYGTILNIIFLCAILGVGYHGTLKGNVVVLSRWFVGYILAYSLLFVPKVDVMIIDKIYGESPRVVKHVPFGIAGLAHLSSHIGDALTCLFEATFSTPDDVKYNQTGMLMASNMIEKTAFLPISDEAFAKNLRSFTHQCVVFEAIRGKKYTIDDLKKSTNVWELISQNASKAHAFPYNDKIITCYDGAKKLSEEWKKQISKAKATYSNRYYQKANTQAMENAVFLSHLPGAYEYLLGVSRSAEQILQQQLMLQAVIDGVDSFSAETGSVAAVQQFASARAKIQQHASYAIVGQLALEKLPLMRAIFECLLYGIFPIIFLLILLPQGTGVLMIYVKALFWVHSWGPLFALLNVFFNYAAKIGSISAATTSSGVGVSLETLPGIYDINTKIVAFAGFMSSFIPILSWSIFKNGPGVLANISASLFGINQSSAMSAADEATTGNLRYGNTDFNNHHLNNLSANKYDTNASVSAGAFKMHDSDMVQYTVSPSGSVIADSGGAISRIGTHVNAAETMRSITGEQSMHSQQLASQKQAAYEERAAESLVASAMLGKHLNQEHSNGHSYSESESRSAAEFAKEMHDEVKRESEMKGTSDVEGNQRSLSGYIRGSLGAGKGGGKGFSMFGLKGMAEAGAEFSGRAYWDHSESKGKQSSNDISNSEGHGRSGEKGFRTLSEELKRSGDSYGASLAEKADVAFQESASSALAWQTAVSESQAWSEMASQQNELSSSANFNWDQELFSRVAKMPAPGSTDGEMGEMQAARVLNNPSLSKAYTHRAMHEMAHEKMNAKLKTLALEQETIKLNPIHEVQKSNLERKSLSEKEDLAEKYKMLGKPLVDN